MKENFLTPEISLAAAIISNSHKLERISREKGSDRALFVFLNTVSLSHLVETFWQKQLLVNVHTFYENLKFLKARLRNGTTETRD